MMRKILVLLPAICLSLVAFSAKADDTLAFISNPSGTEIGPYTMQLGSTGQDLSLFCMNDQNFIQGGEYWSVNVVNGANLSTVLSASLATSYEEEAYIYSQYNGTNATDVQDALWEIFDSNDVPSSDANAQALYTASLNLSDPFYTNGSLSNYNFYLYDPNGTNVDDGGSIHDQYGNYDPQNFIGAAPEPSSLALLGSGLIGMVGVARRRLARRG